MNFEFSPSKDASNQSKHGVSLALAADLEWETALVWIDTRFAYDEVRMSALGYIGMRLYFVAYADDGNRLRIISLRKATSTEVKRYAEA